MPFREYQKGAVMVGVTLGASMAITTVVPAFQMQAATASVIALEKQAAYGEESAFHYDDIPNLRLGVAEKPVTVDFRDADGKKRRVYVDEVAGTVKEIRVGNAPVDSETMVLAYNSGKDPRAEGKEIALVDITNTTVTTSKGKTVTLKANVEDLVAQGLARESQLKYIGQGKAIFVREGCWWCHTLLPEQGHDWQYFGMPPGPDDMVGESPTLFGSDRKAPDLLHVGSRQTSRAWMTQHFWNPRLVQPKSMMPRFDYLWSKNGSGTMVDGKGNAIDEASWDAQYQDYLSKVDAGDFSAAPPAVPSYGEDSDVRKLLDYVLSLK